MTSELAQSQTEQQLSNLGATNVTFETTTVNGRDVLLTSYQLSVNAADGTPTTIFGQQAALVAGGQGWFMTFSAGASSADTFATIVESFDVND